MIRDYSDHAANERTFLAWLRTSIAVIAFGFVVEKLNLLALTLPSATSLDETRRAQLERLAGPLGRGAGHAFIVVGILSIVVATVSLRAHRAAAG
jgi:putative membrane protein